MDHTKTRHDCVCGRCGAAFTVVTESGPSRICNACADRLLAVIHGGAITGRDKFGNVVIAPPVNLVTGRHL
jgi:hypothetical protein